MACVYGIRCKINDRHYVGASKSFKKRIWTHFNQLSLGFHRNNNLQIDYDLFGREAFEPFIIEDEVENRFEKEIFYINEYAKKFIVYNSIVGVKPGTKRGPYKKSDREPLTAEYTVYTTKSKKKKLQERYGSKELQNEFRKLIDKLIK